MSRIDPFEVCPWPKHRGEPWDEVVVDDPEYVSWLVGYDGPEMDRDLYDHILGLLEDSRGF